MIMGMLIRYRILNYLLAAIGLGWLIYRAIPL